MTSDFAEPLCLAPDGGSATGNILFRVENTGPLALQDLTLVDQRSVSTSGGMLFLNLLVCPVGPDKCEFRTNSPENITGCRFNLAVGATFACAISQTVTTTTRSFGENASVTGLDACGNAVESSATHVTHVSTTCTP